MEETFWSHVRRLNDAAPGLLGTSRDDCIREIYAEETFRELLTFRFRTGTSPREQYDHGITSGAAVRQIEQNSVGWSCVAGLAPDDVAREFGDPPVSAGRRRNPITISDTRPGAYPDAYPGAFPDSDPNAFPDSDPNAFPDPDPDAFPDAFPDAEANALSDAFELPHDAPTNASIEEKRYLLQAAADAAFSLEPGLSDLELTFQGNVRRTAVWASDSPPAYSVRSGVAIRIAARLDEAAVHAIGGGSGGLGAFLLTPPEELAGECIDRLRRIRSARPFRPASHDLPIVLEAGWGGVWLHEAIGHLLEADTPGGYRAESIGSQVAPEGVTLIDDGTLEHGRASGRYDDEGQPSSRNVLIRDGRLEALMTDRITARRTGLPRTGNGRRQGYRFQPMPRMTNLMLAAGSTVAADLIADVDHGLYARTVACGRVHPASDAFTLNVLDGTMIEKGRLTAPVAGVRLYGRPSDVLWRIAGIGDDFRMDPARGTCAKGGQVVPVSVGMPTILLSRMSVAPIT